MSTADPRAGARHESVLVWFRRDLRWEDHTALHHALRRYQRVYCLFVFDTDILSRLPDRHDRRVEFIHTCVAELDAGLQALALRAGAPGSGLIVRHGAARECVASVAQELGVQAVFTHRDYEPQARARDQVVAGVLQQHGMTFHEFKDHALLDCSEVLNRQGEPYRVFTPYARAWWQALDEDQRQLRPTGPYARHLAVPPNKTRLPSLKELGFESTGIERLLPVGVGGARQLLQDFLPRLPRYAELRNFPAQYGVSRLSMHLRFGTISVRELVCQAWPLVEQGCPGARSWVSELAWRDFYFMILWHHPQVVEQEFRPEFRDLRWEDESAAWAAWCEGRTGYPLVDAAMRQLLQTGYMHNRLRMLTASFLTKDLGINWRQGERFFARHLNDYDLAANNGGWQWAASTGCDAQPWFRIFNPIVQSRKFDPDGEFIRAYVPELAKVPARHIHFPAAMPVGARQACNLRLGVDYPVPIVDHAAARVRALMRYEGFGEFN